MDPAARFGYDEPHAVHVVAVLFGVVGGEDDARRRSEIEEAGNCTGKERNGNNCPCHSLSTRTQENSIFVPEPFTKKLFSSVCAPPKIGPHDGAGGLKAISHRTEQLFNLYNHYPSPMLYKNHFRTFFFQLIIDMFR